MAASTSSIITLYLIALFCVNEVSVLLFSTSLYNLLMVTGDKPQFQPFLAIQRQYFKNSTG